MIGTEDLLAKHRDSLAKSGWLRRDIVGASRNHEVGPLISALGKAGQNCH